MGIEVFVKVACLRRELEDLLSRRRRNREVIVKAVSLVRFGGHLAAGLVVRLSIRLNLHGVMCWDGRGKVERERDGRLLLDSDSLGMEHRDEKNKQTKNLRSAHHGPL